MSGAAKKAGKPASKAPIEYHHSAGGLVMLEGKILLISTRQGRRWQLPKGHLEPGETSEQAAIRRSGLVRPRMGGWDHASQWSFQSTWKQIRSLKSISVLPISRT